MTALAFAVPRRIHPALASAAGAAPPAAGRWLAALVVAVLLATFGLAARGGR